MLHLMLAEGLLLDLRLASEKRNLEGVRQNRGRNRTVSKSPHVSTLDSSCLGA